MPTACLDYTYRLFSRADLASVCIDANLEQLKDRCEITSTIKT